DGDDLRGARTGGRQPLVEGVEVRASVRALQKSVTGEVAGVERRWGRRVDHERKEGDGASEHAPALPAVGALENSRGARGKDLRRVVRVERERRCLQADVVTPERLELPCRAAVGRLVDLAVPRAREDRCRMLRID